MGDHSETLQIDFDPNVIDYNEILEHFWYNHNPRRHGYGGRQYMSILLYSSEEQKEQALRKKEAFEKSEGMLIETEISPLREFWLAEDYHQKYYLKRWASAAEAVMSLDEEHDDFVNATLAARLNGFVKGFGSIAAIKEEVQEWELPEEEKARLTNTIRSIKW